LDRRGTSFVEEFQLKAIMRTVGILAFIVLLTRFGLAAFDDVVAVTVGTKHGHAYHDALLPEAIRSMAHVEVKYKSAT
jgi:hypothetical protein